MFDETLFPLDKIKKKEIKSVFSFSALFCEENEKNLSEMVFEVANTHHGEKMELGSLFSIFLSLSFQHEQKKAIHTSSFIQKGDRESFYEFNATHNSETRGNAEKNVPVPLKISCWLLLLFFALPFAIRALAFRSLETQTKHLLCRTSIY